MGWHPPYGSLRRQQIKAMLDEWQRRGPGRRGIIFRALSNLQPSHLADPLLFDFSSLAIGAVSPYTGSENP